MLAFNQARAQAAAVTVFLVAVSHGYLQAADDIKPADAKEYEGKSVRVTLTVNSSNHLEDRNICFLNSEKDHRADDNFVVVLRSKGLTAFSDAGIKKPANHFYKKEIRVSGIVSIYKGRPQIIVTMIKQIEKL